MKPITLVVVGRMLVAIACALSASHLAYEGKPGWGWFLFAATWLGAIVASEKTGDKIEDAS
jgi:hypothetical protein